MRVAFIQDTGINESPALLALSGVLRAAGHGPRLFIEQYEHDVLVAVQAFAPELICVAVDLGAEPWGLAMLRRLAATFRDTPVVMLGTYPTLDEAAALAASPVDLVIPGETEAALPALIDVLSTRDPARLADVPGLFYRTRDGAWHRNAHATPLDDLDALPPPDFSLFEPYPHLLRLPVRRFVSSRGCLYACSYCPIEPLRGRGDGHGSTYRRMSATRFVDVIVETLSRYPAPHVHMSDDLFTVEPEWLIEFSRLYRARVGVRFTCNGTTSSLKPRVVEALAEAGCHAIAMGIEVGREDVRARLLNKPMSNRDIIEVCARLRAHGILVATNNLIALPGETLDDALHTLRFNQELGTTVPRVNFAVPVPGLTLTRQAYERGDYTEADRRRYDEIIASGQFRLRPWFENVDNAAFERLYYVFALSVLMNLSTPTVRSLLAMPASVFDATLRPAGVAVQMRAEQRFFRMTTGSALRHVMSEHAASESDTVRRGARLVTQRTKNINTATP